MNCLDNDVLKQIFLCKSLYIPFGNNLPKKNPLSLMRVSKKWHSIVQSVIIPLINLNRIKWTHLTDVRSTKGIDKIVEFLSIQSNALKLKRLDLKGVLSEGKTINQMLSLCTNVKNLLLSHGFFQMENLLAMPKLKKLNICGEAFSVKDRLGELTQLKTLKLQGSFQENYPDLSQCNSLKNLYIMCIFQSSIDNIPTSLKKLSLQNVLLNKLECFKNLTNLKQLSLSVFDTELPSLGYLPGLNALSLTSNRIPHQYFHHVPKITRLKVCRSENLPSIEILSQLSQLFLIAVHNPNLHKLGQLKELTLCDCEFSSNHLKGLFNLQKLTIKNQGYGPKALFLDNNVNLETLKIRSDTLITVWAYSLTKLFYITINCKKLKFFVLPKQIPSNAEIDIKSFK